MTNQTFIKILLLLGLILFGTLTLFEEEKLIKFEKNIKAAVIAGTRTIQVLNKERKLKMKVILKSAYENPITVTDVPCSFSGVATALDAEHCNAIGIGNGIELWYDADGFAKCLAPNITDRYSSRTIHGDVIFTATNERTGNPRELIPSELKYVQNYIREHRIKK